MTSDINKSRSGDLDELIVEIKNNIKTRLGDLISKLLNDADNRLFDLADSASSNEEQTRYFDLMRLLRENKAEISAEFNLKIIPLLRPYTATEAEKQSQKDGAEDELSLVDQADMDDMVMIKSIGERAAGMYREQLAHLEARLEHLALKTPKIFAKDALKPVNFCQAFDDAITDHFDQKNKKILFNMFFENVATRLNSLYDSINNRLIDAGILPQIKLQTGGITPKRRKMDRPPQNPEAAVEQQPYFDDGQPHSVGGYAMTAAPGSTYGRSGGSMPVAGMPGARQGTMAGGVEGGGGGYIQGSAQPGQVGGYAQGGSAAPGGGYSQGGPGSPGVPGSGFPGGPVARGGAYSQGAMQPPIAGTGGASGAGSSGGASGAGGSGGNGGAGGGAAGASAGDSAAGGMSEVAGPYHHYTAGIPANRVSQIIGGFIGAPIMPPAKGESAVEGGENAYYPASTPQYFGHDEILTALSSLQAQPDFSQPSELRFDANAIKQAILSSIATRSGGAVTKRINHIAEKTIDFIELVFDAIIDDKEISDTIKALLLRLQIPVIKASMLDPEFFIYDDHPARELLDRIAEVGVGISDHSDEVYIKLDRIVSQLVNEYELSTETFQKALDKLKAFIAEQEEIARAKEEEAQQQVLRAHARNVVLRSLRGITAGKILPEAVHPLVLKRWPTLMFNHYLEHGKENDKWVEIVELLRDIIDSVQPIDSAESLAYLLAEKEQLTTRARQHLNRTNQSKKDISDVIAGLEETHASLIENCDFSENQMEAAEATVAEQGPRQKPEPIADKSTEPRQKLPRDIMPGMWFEVYIEEDKPIRRCKLSVIIVEDSKLIFVNHAGELVIEKNFDEFRHELDGGSSKLIMGHSVFDHALSSVITHLQPAV
jgi:hypothetical protein